jgi:hypothetical protein
LVGGHPGGPEGPPYRAHIGGPEGPPYIARPGGPQGPPYIAHRGGPEGPPYIAHAATQLPVEGIVREERPSENTVLSGVRVEVVGGGLKAEAVTTDERGVFVLPTVPKSGFSLQLSKPGYESRRVDVAASAASLDLAMKPEPAQVALNRSGANACTDLPPPPKGVPGLREYARIAVHHDGNLVVTAAQLPFFGNQGYVYRQTESGWEKNEIDYVLVRTPVPLRGGFVYSITFGGDKESCGRWSLDATHPR